MLKVNENKVTAKSDFNRVQFRIKRDHESNIDS